ncbi:hypothetical protein NKJ36_28505 [Mesorhizobium sp. M0142]|uniref:hypothetical protein n=1 Tax=Mesorhizobium sp. M0142 TaxID=2956894 RepID=UPI00333C5A4F
MEDGAPTTSPICEATEDLPDIVDLVLEVGRVPATPPKPPPLPVRLEASSKRHRSTPKPPARKHTDRRRQGFGAFCVASAPIFRKGSWLLFLGTRCASPLRNAELDIERLRDEPHGLPL